MPIEQMTVIVAMVTVQSNVLRVPDDVNIIIFLILLFSIISDDASTSCLT